MGCSSTPMEGSTPAPVIVAPGVSPKLRADQLAATGGQITRLTAQGVQLGEDTVPIPGSLGLAGLPDGRAAVIAVDDGQVQVSLLSAGSVETHSALIPTATGPMTVLAEPTAAHLWVVQSDRRRAARYGLEPLAGQLIINRTVALPGGRSDVAVLPDGTLLASTGSRLVRVAADGQQTPLPRESSAVIERIAVDPAGGVWVLEFTGRLVKLNADTGIEEVSVALPGSGVALAVDQDGAAVVTATWTNAERNRWSIHLYAPDGTPRWSADGDPTITERGLAMSGAEVAFGGRDGVRRWHRTDGAPLPPL